MIDATLEDGELLLSFTGHEVTFRGFNLGGLLEAVVECRLEKGWELPSDYRPPANLKCPSVSKIEVGDSEFGPLDCADRGERSEASHKDEGDG